MKSIKRQKKNFTQAVEKMSVFIFPLLIVLLIGVLARPWTTELVVQAKSNLEQSNAAVANLTNNSSAVTSVQGSEIPNSSFAISVANGINFSAGNYRLDNAGKLAIDFCFDQVNTEDWTIWSSRVVDQQGLNANPSEGDLLEIRYPPVLIDGKPRQQIIDFRGESSSEIKNYYVDADPNQNVGQRCAAITYILPPKFDLSKFTITVENILAYPDENTQCSDAVLANVQRVLDERQTGIHVKLKAETSDSGGMCGLEIAQKPEQMSLNEAMSILNSNEMLIDLYGIRGPWIFEGGLK